MSSIVQKAPNLKTLNLSGNEVRTNNLVMLLFLIVTDYEWVEVREQLLVGSFLLLWVLGLELGL